MENLNKKVIWNAVSAYFMFFVSLGFLFSKNPNISHPFVKSHVKVAFFLHILFLAMLICMSFPIGVWIGILWYSVNTILTIFFSILIFSWIFYGIFRAHRWETLSISELFKHGKKHGHEFITLQNSTKITEEHKTLLFLSHIPFIWYIVSGSYARDTTLRNIVLLNLMVSVTWVFWYVVGFSSVASLIFLLYIIWCIFQGIKIFTGDEIHTLNLDKIPDVKEKYIIQKSILIQLWNSLSRKKFIPMQETIKSKTLKFQKTSEEEAKKLQKLSPSFIPNLVYYIPVVNLVGIFFLKTQSKLHIRNGLLITITFWILVFFYGIHGRALIFLLFPICFGIWKREKIDYLMPYLYDIWNTISKTLYGLTHLFQKTRKLQKTETKKTVKMNETKKES